MSFYQGYGQVVHQRLLGTAHLTPVDMQPPILLSLALGWLYEAVAVHEEKEEVLEIRMRLLMSRRS